MTNCVQVCRAFTCGRCVKYHGSITMTVFRPDTPGSAPSRTQCPRRRSSAARPSSQGRRQILQEGIHQVPLSSRMTIGGPSPLKMLSTGSSKSGGAPSRYASKVWTTTTTTTLTTPIKHPWALTPDVSARIRGRGPRTAARAGHRSKAVRLPLVMGEAAGPRRGVV